jgi:citrate lyase beta subunit
MSLLLRSSLITAFFCLAACKAEPRQQEYVTAISAEEAIAKAESDAKRIHLAEDLEAAGTNTKKIARVYSDAKELGSENIKTQADAKLSAIMVPKAKAANWEGTFRKLLKTAPEGSQTAQRIKLIAAKKHHQ